MSELLLNNNSLYELKNRIEIIKIKRLIEDSTFNYDLKNKICDYLFFNDCKFNDELLSYGLPLYDIVKIVGETIQNFDNSSSDFMLFKKSINEKTKKFYNNIQKSVSYNNFESLRRKNGVYYITPYIVLDNRTGDIYSKLSQDIYDYKEYERNIDYFTKELMKAISYLSNNHIPDNIENLALVCLPRSTKGLISTIQKSIDNIEEWYDNGITDMEYNCSKNIINSKGLLTRFKTIERSSKGAYLTEMDHLNSIKCNSYLKSDLNNTAFILLDDVTTHGNIMRACRKLLINKNIKQNNIYMLAIGGTRSF